MNHGFATRSLHAGQSVDPDTGSRAPPIYQTTSYVFEDADAAADLYALAGDGDVYTRVSNPTNRTLEARLASLEGGVGAVATASGMAALDGIATVLAEAGDNVVAAADMYGGTATYLTRLAPRRGVEARLVDTLDVDAYADAIDEDTAFVHLETLANPALVTPDIEAIADAAHERGVPLVVDNTFATPALCNPVDHGADVVWESTTKWIHGSGSTVGGVVVDGGSFPWTERAGDYPAVTGAGGDVDFTERFPEAPFAAAVRHRAVRRTGGSQSPFDAWVTLQGVETLPLRMARHCENAALVADALADHDAVASVGYPGRPDHPTHANATRYLDGDPGPGTAAGGTPGGYGGVVTVTLAGGAPVAKRVCEAVELTSFLANIGDGKSVVIHPASTTHAGLDEAEQRAAGVTPGLLRLSVGLEDPADVVADLERAIAVAAREVPA